MIAYKHFFANTRMSFFSHPKPKKKMLLEKYQWQPEGYPQILEVSLRRSSQSRAIRVLVNQEGRVTVTAPLRTSRTLLLRILTAQTVWILKKRDQFLTPSFRTPKLAGSDQEFKEYKKKALELVETKLQYWNQHYGFRYNQVNVRNQSTRWGSCSAKGNLNFHYRIIFLPEHLADYLIVHELCHLKAFDHSVHFWTLVEKTIPDFRACRKALKKA